MYQQFSRPQAFRGILRFRTSPEIAVSRLHGPYLPDPKHADIYHFAACDSRRGLAFDMEYTTAAAFPSAGGRHPMVQVVFAYNTVVWSAKGYVPVRRLRVYTKPVRYSYICVSSTLQPLTALLFFTLHCRYPY